MNCTCQMLCSNKLFLLNPHKTAQEIATYKEIQCLNDKPSVKQKWEQSKGRVCIMHIQHFIWIQQCFYAHVLQWHQNNFQNACIIEVLDTIGMHFGVPEIRNACGYIVATFKAFSTWQNYEPMAIWSYSSHPSSQVKNFGKQYTKIEQDYGLSNLRMTSKVRFQIRKLIYSPLWPHALGSSLQNY